MTPQFHIHLPAHGDPAAITDALGWWQKYLTEFPDDTGDLTEITIRCFDPADRDWPRHCGLPARWIQSHPDGFNEAMYHLPTSPYGYGGYVSSEALWEHDVSAR